jgi:hypothetical protein
MHGEVPSGTLVESGLETERPSSFNSCSPPVCYALRFALSCLSRCRILHSAARLSSRRVGIQSPPSVIVISPIYPRNQRIYSSQPRKRPSIHLSFKISEAPLDGREDAVERRFALLRLVLCGHMRGVYHIGRLGHECADRVDVTQHENWKKRARILEAGERLKIMRTGCGVHHGFREGRGQRGAGLSGRLAVGFDSRSGAPTVGEIGI